MEDALRSAAQPWSCLQLSHPNDTRLPAFPISPCFLFPHFRGSAYSPPRKDKVVMVYTFEKGLYGRLRRPLDWLYIFFFAVHFLASVLVDGACHKRSL